jgi:5-methylcytosine-specific restriction endonuclease McrA
MMAVAIVVIIASLVIYNSICDKVKKISPKIKKLENLNKNISFYDVPSSISMEKRYDNKSHYNKMTPAYYMASRVKNELEVFEDYIHKIRENRIKKESYDILVDEIRSSPCEVSKEVLNQERLSKNMYLHFEEKIFNKTIINPTLGIKITVNLYYTSPNGRYSYTHSDTFGFDNLVACAESVSRTYLDKKTYEAISVSERAEVSDSMRYDVLKRDNFRCVICGASRDDGARLHVDHIYPISKGGKSVPSNLRTLCERCNVGKSDKIEDIDFQNQPNDQSPKNESPIARCPTCRKGYLVKRRGRNGEFFGCSNYPNCRYTRN